MMKIYKTINSIRRYLNPLRGKKKSIGFVPTMGFFHEGHLSLIRQSVRDNDTTVVSIYVNPTQFGPGEDLANYPRNLKRDLALARQEGVDALFLPTNQVMYPDGYQSYVEVEGLTDVMCGKTRPGHFRGVTTIVNKLLNIVAPTTMYLGQKDYQQCAVLKKMVTDLNIPVKIKVCPTGREKSGLALSSRNKYLSSRQHNEAKVLFEALSLAKQKILDGEKNSTRLKKHINMLISKKSKSRIDYIYIGDQQTLKPIKKVDGKCFIALAVYFGRARLIDNLVINVK